MARSSSLLILIGALGATTAAGQDGPGAYKEAPSIAVDPRLHRVGQLIPDLPFTSIAGEATSLARYAEGRPLVIAIRDVGCPLSKKYGPRLAEIEQALGDKDVRFLYVNPSEIDTVEQMRAEKAAYGFQGAYVADREGTIARTLGCDRTTDVFLLDGSRTLMYRGAIDDQYGIGFQHEAPRHTYLLRAIDAVLANRTPDVRATTAPGCAVDWSGRDVQPVEPAITYHSRISRIMQQHCQSCHREDGVAPFALETYQQVRARRGAIRQSIETGVMPPWHAGEGSRAFLNDRSLSARDRNALFRWIEDGCLEGDPSDAPRPLVWTEGWEIGEPHAVVTIPDPVSVPAQGAMGYRYQYVKTDFPEDRWIRAMEIRPTHPEVVHHVLVFIEGPPREGETRREIQARWQGGLQGYFAGLVPGQATTMYPEGTAKRLPAGAWLKFQLHYTPNGRAVEDRTQIGFIFADTAPEREMHTSAAMTTRLDIPPGASNHEVKATTTFSRPAVIQSFAPHMHVRGKAYRYELTWPDGTSEVVLDIPRYDFNWQTRYVLREPIRVPAGTKLTCTAWYDNSDGNPANPNPKARVRFGEQTWDEMMIGYFEYWRDE